MAEAHQAVSYSELIKQEHTDANHDKEVLFLIGKSGLRSWKKRIARSINKIRNGVYPAHLESLFIIIGAVMALHFAKQKVPFDLMNKFLPLMPE
jgi:carnitine O-palmitoyltransferase 1, liver isoform